MGTIVQCNKTLAHIGGFQQRLAEVDAAALVEREFPGDLAGPIAAGLCQGDAFEVIRAEHRLLEFHRAETVEWHREGMQGVVGVSTDEDDLQRESGSGESEESATMMRRPTRCEVR
jgi:hypothetical protein